ncbi:hypothetical protein PV783_33995 [Chitinophaga sp. CC14]|uniref:hypothetical protein n=1 Tax=Chitinophaga sp. CC14 TaxID=3029199 RepID=UPI003B78D498
MDKNIQRWYVLRGAEYSTDFNFFLAHQIAVGQCQHFISYFSRLTGMNFIREVRTKDNSDADHRTVCEAIHANLMAGYYGAGMLSE